MTNRTPPRRPPFCPNETCAFHRNSRSSWRYVREGAYFCRGSGKSIRRYRCLACGRYFSDRTFRAGYWLRKPRLLHAVAQGLTACSGYRQIARNLGVSPQTVARHAARLGRQALLAHRAMLGRRRVAEPAALDSLVNFVHSQYQPTHYHFLAGRASHFCYGFTESECRRSGTMNRRQRAYREMLEGRFGRPDPKANEKEVAALLMLFTSEGGALDLTTDEDPAYVRAIRRLARRAVRHRTISSRAARTPQNPLFAVNLIDLLVRHCCADQKRETIAFSKSRLGAILRLWLFVFWRNYVKSFSEKKPGATPAERAGITEQRWTLRDLVRRRWFPGRIRLPAPWKWHYEGRVPTRVYPARSTVLPRYAY